MPFIGPKPADTVLDSTLIADGSITSAKIADGAIVNADLNNSAAIATSKITGLAASATTDTTNAANIASGTIADARISASSVQQHATSFDDNQIVNDISTLAIRQASNENKSAYNTQSMYVDVFQDGTGIASNTNAPRNASEFVSSIVSTTSTADAGGTLVESGSLPTSESTDWFTPLQAYGNTNYHFLSASKVELGRNQSYNFSMLYRHALSGDIVFGSLAHNNFTGSFNNTFQIGLTTNEGTNIFGSPNGIVNTHMNGWNSSNFNNNYLIMWNGAGSNKDWVVQKNGATLASGTHTFTQSANTSNDTRVFAQRVGSTLSFAYQEGSSGARTKFYTLSSSEFNSTANLYGVFSSGGNTSADCNWFPSIRDDATSIKGETTITASATGNFISNAITAPSSVSSMGAIITYQDNAGTNALNTDIVLQLSADNGSNFTTATMTAMPDFASGIKMAKVNDLSVTAGTQLKYKISFANQASGSKEARIRGVSLQY